MKWHINHLIPLQYCAEHGAAFDEAVLEDDMQEGRHQRGLLKQYEVHVAGHEGSGSLFL